MRSRAHCAGSVKCSFKVISDGPFWRGGEKACSEEGAKGRSPKVQAGEGRSDEERWGLARRIQGPG